MKNVACQKNLLLDESKSFIQVPLQATNLETIVSWQNGALISLPTISSKIHLPWVGQKSWDKPITSFYSGCRDSSIASHFCIPYSVNYWRRVDGKYNEQYIRFEDERGVQVLLYHFDMLKSVWRTSTKFREGISCFKVSASPTMITFVECK